MKEELRLFLLLWAKDVLCVRWQFSLHNFKFCTLEIFPKRYCGRVSSLTVTRMLYSLYPDLGRAFFDVRRYLGPDPLCKTCWSS